MDDKSNAPQEKTVTAYKGFDMNFRCRDFQFEIGRTYQHEGAVEACVSGFHACEYPLDVFRYYHPATSRFAIVTQSGQLSRHHNDSKVASSVMRVESEIGLSELIQAAVAYVAGRCVPCDEQGAASATGGYGAASATGGYGAASATGGYGAASATGYMGAASATGHMGAASATGYMGAASATGGYGAASATGYMGAASATGDYGAASATSSHGAASATGYHGAASATGDHGAASATGYMGAASATGYHGVASATGYMGAASATGYMGAASATGGNGVACSLGYQGVARAGVGGAICLCHRLDDGTLTHIRASKVGENGIKPDTWYRLSATGEFVEVGHASNAP